MALAGVKVIEFAGLAPAPFCGMVLRDFGASVTRIDKVNGSLFDHLGRGKRSVAVDLKKPEGVNVIRKLCRSADVLIEPFRRGVMEKLGLGPKILLKDNDRLVYARLTGFGQTGPYSDMAGHDINYVAVSGILSMLGRKHENPFPPLNLMADFAGGGLMCSLGICMALLERVRSGKGQVVDANMVDGSAYVGSWLWKSRDMFIWGKPRGENVLDSGTHFYETYRTKDGKHMAVGALEPQFYGKFIEGLGLQPDDLTQFDDPHEGKNKVAAIFAQKTQAEWCEVFDGTDACVTPVLSLDEAPLHPHNKQHGTFLAGPNGPEPSPAPRLERTPAQPDLLHPEAGQHTKEILLEAGYTAAEVQDFLDRQVVEQCDMKAKL